MFGISRQKDYDRVPGGEDKKCLIPESPSSSSLEADFPAHRSGRVSSPLISAVILIVTAILTCVLGLLIGRRFPADLNATCTRHTSKYSPVTEEVDITYNMVQYNGSFYKEDIYRLDASPEVDAAWEDLGSMYRSGTISEELGHKAGLTKDHAKRNKKYGGGFVVLNEGLHHIHCLNLLRKGLYYNYDYYHSRAKVEFSDADWAQRLHITHCLDILRQRLMCAVDIGIFGSYWVQNGTRLRPFVDFNTQHKCRNYDDVRKWGEVRQIPEKEPDDFMEEPGPEVNILSEFP